MANIDVYSLTLPNDNNAYWLKDKSLQDAKGAANGIAELDSTGKVPSSQLPEIPSGGHTIKNSAGTSMTQRENLQFVDATVSDDSTNDVTKIENVRIINSESELTNAPDGLYMGSYDDAGDAIGASDVAYSNTTSGMASTDVQSAIDEIVAMKGANSGLAELDAAGKVPSAQLPSYVDDVIEVADYSHLPITGETGKIYVTLDDNKTYRWSGSAYVEISESLALGETSSTAYAGDKGKANADNITTIQGLIPSGATTSNKLATANDVTPKADKVTSATSGNLAGLNASGNLTDSGWASDKTTNSASGNPISITGLKSNQLAVNPVITFEPIQAGSGDPSPSNVRAISGYDKIEVLSCGKNLCDNSKNEVGGYYNGSGVWTSSSGYASTGLIPVAPNTQYRGHIYDKNGNALNDIVWTKWSNETTCEGQVTDAYITTGANTRFVRLRNWSEEADYIRNNNFLFALEKGNTSSTTYPAYHKTTDLSEPLPQTVYWGRLNVRTGEFDVLGGSVDLANLEYNVYGTNYVTKTAISNIKIPATQSTPPSGVAERRVIKAYSIFGANSLVINTDGKLTIDGSAEAPAGLFVYELADSAKFTIQLTPHEISLLKDYAYVSTNGTSIALDYHNGEIATLGDVSQLGETVEGLGKHLTPVGYGTPEIITPDANYTVPSMGFITIQAAKNAVITFWNYTPGINRGFIISGGTSNANTCVIPVFGGMIVKVIQSSGTADAVFYPYKYADA